jgi:hypothetical protein
MAKGTAPAHLAGFAGIIRCLNKLFEQEQIDAYLRIYLRILQDFL